MANFAGDGLSFSNGELQVASTKTGGSPLVGNHSLDPDLFSVMCRYMDRTHIVTRNSYRDDIVTFLKAKGVVGVPIHSVKKHESKAAVVCDPARLLPSQVALFVDDSIQEHAAPELSDNPQVHRVLFSRAT